MRFKNIVLGVGIFIVYFLVLLYGIQTFYPEPKYEDYCTYRYPTIYREPAVNCTYSSELSAKEQACYAIKGEFRSEYDSRGCVTDGYCDECGINYQDAISKYNTNVFWIALIIGLITIIVGYSIFSIEPIGSGLMASGVLAIVYGSVRNWQNFTNAIKFGLLVFVLIVLILLALRVNKKSGFLHRIGFKK